MSKAADKLAKVEAKIAETTKKLEDLKAEKKLLQAAVKVEAKAAKAKK